MAENVDNKNRPTGSNKYSLYAGREEAVNWGQVAADVTKGLTAIRDQREAAKQKINEDTNAALAELSEIAEVSAPSMNSLLIDGSDFSKNTLQTAMQAVRSGLMDPKDYMLIMQNQKDGYKSLSNYAKNYDAKYKEGTERIKNGEAANLEEFFRSTGFSFGNTKNKKLWTDPATGELVLVEMIPDPDNPGKFMMPSRKNNTDKYQTPSSMLNLINYQENARNLSEDVKTLVTGNLAEITESLVNSYSVRYGGGAVTSLTDFRQLFEDVQGADGIPGMEGKSYDDWLTGQAGGVVSDPKAAAEYLTNSNLGYSFTLDPQEAADDPKKILVKSDGGPPELELTEEQMADAVGLAKEAINTQLDSVMKNSSPLSGRTDPVADRINKEEKEEEDKQFGYIKQINTMLTGDTNAARNEAQNLIDQYNSTLEGDELKKKGIRGIVVTDDSIIITRNDRSTYEVQRFDIDDDDPDNLKRINTAISKDATNIFNQIVPGLTDTVSEDEILENINKNNYSFGERRDVKDEILNFRRGSKDLSPAVINEKPSEVLGGKSPLQYLRDDFGDSTFADEMKDEIGKSIRDALSAMIPTDVLDINKDLGYKDPFGSFEVDDSKDTIKFSFGGEEFFMEFRKDKTPEEVFNKMKEVISKGISNINKNRGADKFDVSKELTYSEWVKDTTANPDASKSYADFLKWLQSN
tara:strand:+ start:1024 stop:3102 length:2079 start_codon:yes stop_codon:yes gene_type:complete